MKIKSVLFALVIAGIVLNGCAGSPSYSPSPESSGQIMPNFEGFTPEDYSGITVIEYDPNSLQPQYNLDGSITMFSTKSVQFKIMPMIGIKDQNPPNRGPLNRTAEEFDEKISQYEADLAANPEDYDACIMLAGLYIDRNDPGDADMAVKYSNQALAIRKDDSDAIYARGLAYSNKNDVSSRDNALGDLEIVLRSNVQRMKGVYYVMGMIYSKSVKIDEAIEAFEKVKAIDPDFVDTNEILDLLYSFKK